jgi:hypothetical protein
MGFPEMDEHASLVFVICDTNITLYGDTSISKYDVGVIFPLFGLGVTNTSTTSAEYSGSLQLEYGEMISKSETLKEMRRKTES